MNAEHKGKSPSPDALHRFLNSLLLAACLLGCRRNDGPVVVVYTSQDHVYAEPILGEFTRQTGIAVRAVYDSEAVKTVGIANRLLAEKNQPQCDVFWNNEELRTRQLAARNVFRATNGWSGFGYRRRCLVVNTNRLPLSAAPRSLMELTNSTWRAKVALAYPLFGTTATHFLALRQAWGQSPWLQWCQALQANQPFLVDGNSVVVKLVGRGEAWMGLTDTDDVRASQREGLPVADLPFTSDGLSIPNTVGVVRDAPHPSAAQSLFIYLQSPPVTERLIQALALDGAAVGEATTPTLKVDWDTLLQDLEPATRQLQRIFLR